ncbi:MAG: ABC transporter substrate-binding protein [Nitrospinota bacterium]|nr:MAG: ABC transporter substrate-binding protein [Nitrospinota bacterium]
MTRKGRFFCAVFTLFLASFLLSPLPAVAAEKPRYGGVVQFAEREPPNLDPHLTVSFLTHRALSLIYNGLVRFSYGHEQKDPTDLSLYPDLAERWEYPDSRTVIFHLRKGVRFHDKPPVNGREMTAADVKYSLERFMTRSGFRARFSEVEAIQVLDNYTVKITTKHPFAPLLSHLAAPSYAVVLPKEAEEKYGDFNSVEAAIGTGPFMLTEYKRGVKLTFRKNPNFYVPGLPYLDGVVWQITPKAAARLSLLRAGRVDFITAGAYISQEDAMTLRRTNPELQIDKYDNIAMGYIYMRTDQKPFNDIRVRRAISLAINRQAWLQALHYGEGCINNGPIPCAMKEWQLSLEELTPEQRKYLVGYDPEEARRLLAEAGYPNGFTTPMFHWPGYAPPWPSRYELAVDELGKIGIKVEMKPQEYGDYISTTYVGKYEKMAMGPVTPFLEVDDWLYGMFYPDQPNNRSHVNDPELNKMLVAQRQAIDVQERKRIVKEIQRYLADKAYYVYIPIGVTYHAVSPRLRGHKAKVGYTTGHQLISTWIAE